MIFPKGEEGLPNQNYTKIRGTLFGRSFAMDLPGQMGVHLYLRRPALLPGEGHMGNVG